MQKLQKIQLFHSLHIKNFPGQTILWKMRTLETIQMGIFPGIGTDGLTFGGFCEKIKRKN